MQTLDDAIIDFTPPLPKRCVQEYYRHFVYKQVDAQCYVDGCSRPLMSKSYWVEKDKKVNPHSPTLMYSEPWPPRIRKRKRRTRKCRTVNVGGSLWSLLKGAARVGSNSARVNDIKEWEPWVWEVLFLIFGENHGPYETSSTSIAVFTVCVKRIQSF